MTRRLRSAVCCPRIDIGRELASPAHRHTKQRPALTHTRYRSQRVPGIPGSTKTRVLNARVCKGARPWNRRVSAHFGTLGVWGDVRVSATRRRVVFVVAGNFWTQNSYGVGFASLPFLPQPQLTWMQTSELYKRVLSRVLISLWDSLMFRRVPGTQKRRAVFGYPPEH